MSVAHVHETPGGLMEAVDLVVEREVGLNNRQANVRVDLQGYNPQ